MSSTTAGNAAVGAPLNGRSAVISGASRGIGLECARALHAAGAKVVLVARTKAALGRVTRELGERASAIECDVADPANVQRALAKIRATLGGAPDILVNNAGMFVLAPVERTTVDEFERMLRVNLTSQFAFVREFLSDLRQERRGHIVTIGSIADHLAFPDNAAYAASKYGARGLHEVLRAELRGSGVRATLVSPGPVDTTLWDDVDPDARPGFTPRREMLTASAVADAVRYVVTRPGDVNIDEMRLSRA
ncbi:MAG: SDR family oxidoreductase [Gemmatimonadaceae bacterium]